MGSHGLQYIITRLLDWCYEYDYEVSIDAKLTDKPFPYVSITLSRNGYNVRHIFNLDRFSKNENLYPSTKWFDAGLDYELQSFLVFADNRFSEHKAEAKNDGEM